MVRCHLFSQKSFVLLHNFHELILKLVQSEVTHTWYVHSFVNDGLTSRWFVFCCCIICSCYTGTEWEEICHLKIVKLSELIFCINYEAKWVSGDDLWFCCVYIWKSTVFGFWNKYINIVFFWRSWFSLNSNLNHDLFFTQNYCMTSGCRAQVFLDMFMMHRLKVCVILDLYSPGPHSLFIFEETDLDICQNFTFYDKQKNESHEFGMTWGWVNELQM